MDPFRTRPPRHTITHDRDRDRGRRDRSLAESEQRTAIEIDISTEGRASCVRVADRAKQSKGMKGGCCRAQSSQGRHATAACVLRAAARRRLSAIVRQRWNDGAGMGDGGSAKTRVGCISENACPWLSCVLTTTTMHPTHSINDHRHTQARRQAPVDRLWPTPPASRSTDGRRSSNRPTHTQPTSDAVDTRHTTKQHAAIHATPRHNNAPRSAARRRGLSGGHCGAQRLRGRLSRGARRVLPLAGCVHAGGIGSGLD